VIEDNLSFSPLVTVQAGWTRHLARDLFPGKATPFAWSVLRRPAEAALRRAYGEFGVDLDAAPLWQLAGGGNVYLHEDAVSAADASLQGKAWLGPHRPALKSAGFVARFQSGGAVRRIEARLNQVPVEASELQNRHLQWLGWLRRLRWSQADLLQVMEELEPHAAAALTVYFLARAGLAAAAATLDDRLARGQGEPLGLLFAGLDGLPTLQSTAALCAVAKADPNDADRWEVLSRFGHRGPGEVRPDAARWADTPGLLKHLGGQGGTRSPQTAAAERAAAEAEFQAREPSRWRQAEPALAAARAQFTAVDIAWNTLVMVLAAAQAWVGAMGSDAVSAGILTRAADVLFLELEELKQVATGEWHGGRSDEVEAMIGARRAALAAAEPGFPRLGKLAPVVPGRTSGPAYCSAPVHAIPAPGAVWMAESPDPGAAPFWASAAAVVAASPEPWSPCMVAARALGVPAVAGAVEAVEGAEAGKPVTVDAGAGIVRLAPVV
jgi:phosphohistidine swiveling domain-containing protein